MPACLWPPQQYSTTPHIWQQHQQPQQQQQPKQKRSDAVLKLYKGNWILPVRFLVSATTFLCCPTSRCLLMLPLSSATILCVSGSPFVSPCCILSLSMLP
jgi:hypothetical protein